MIRMMAMRLTLLVATSWMLADRAAHGFVYFSAIEDKLFEIPEFAADVGYQLYQQVQSVGEVVEFSPGGGGCGGTGPEELTGYECESGAIAYKYKVNPCCEPRYCHWYVRAEYLGWWIPGDQIPPLVTTSPASTPIESAGALGQPGTSILFGDEEVNDGFRSGGRVALGMCLSPEARLEGEWFGVGRRAAWFEPNSDGGTILARPFFNASTGEESAEVVAYPGEQSGSIYASISNDFNGAGLHASWLMWYRERPDGLARLDFLYGFRYLGFYERLHVHSSTTGLSSGNQLARQDYFGASTNFYGANLGARYERRSGRWGLSAVGWLGLGGSTHQVAIDGQSIFEAGGLVLLADEGLLAQQSNIGSHRQNEFSVVPQLEAKVSYLLTKNLRWNFGYDLIYWDNVVRVGNAVDLNINSQQATSGPQVPAFSFRESDLFIHGFSTGLELRY